MCHFVRHITWLILTTYICQLGKRIGHEIGITVLTIVYPTSEKKKSGTGERQDKLVIFFSKYQTPQHSAKQVHSLPPFTPSLVSITHDQPRSENSKWECQK